MSILDQFKLNGKAAIVTGAARGLGQGLASALPKREPISRRWT
jgi:short-subunit dehydrogenase